MESANDFGARQAAATRRVARRVSPNGAVSRSPRLPQRGYRGQSVNKPSNRNAVAAHPFPLARL